MKYMPTRQAPRITKIRQQVVLTNHTLLPYQPLIRRPHSRHQVRLAKLVAAVVYPLVNGNPLAVLFGAQRADCIIEHPRIHGVAAMDLGPAVVPNEFVG